MGFLHMGLKGVLIVELQPVWWAFQALELAVVYPCVEGGRWVDPWDVIRPNFSLNRVLRNIEQCRNCIGHKLVPVSKIAFLCNSTLH